MVCGYSVLKMKCKLFAFVVVFGLSVMSAAQQAAAPAVQGSVIDGIGLPGQAWTTLGNVSPIEHNNAYSQSYFEQGATVLASDSGGITVTPYAALGLMFDTKGYPWNNSIEPSAGLKINQFFRNGIVSVGTAYAYQDRYQSIRSSALMFYALDWVGWQSVTEKSSRFPGNSWAIVGNLSPVEHGNLIATGYVSQGVIAKRFNRATLVPFVQSTLSRDSQGLDWENKAIYGGGLKTVVPHGDVYSEFGMAYLREQRFDPARSAAGLSLFMNVSFGWNLLGRKVGR
jgi:hypothetical protein